MRRTSIVPSPDIERAELDVQTMAQAHGLHPAVRRKRDTIAWGLSAPFLLLQLSPLAVIWVGWSWIAGCVALLMYLVRMFAITAFYHRYFSHRAYKTSRALQFVFAVLGNSSCQKGPLWWAAHHRFHHQHSDRAADLHSPARHGFLWSHIGWLVSDLSKPTKLQWVKDLQRFPEIRFLDRHYHLVPALTALALYALGAFLEHFAPQLGTNGWQMLVWGFFVSTVVLFHCTYTINSIAHRFGSRRFETKDDSRNNWFLALITLGEGWHNNHHRFPAAARQGMHWWEIDFTWYVLVALAKLRLVWDLRGFPRTPHPLPSAWNRNPGM